MRGRPVRQAVVSGVMGESGEESEESKEVAVRGPGTKGDMLVVGIEGPLEEIQLYV